MKLIILAVIILGVSAVRFGSDEKKSPPGKELHHSLPRRERLDFLAFSLGDGYRKNSTTHHRNAHDLPFPDALGIDKELIEKFKTLEMPEGFTTNLFGWTRTSFNLDHGEMRQLIANRSVCLSNGECIDIGDIGGLCCPF